MLTEDQQQSILKEVSYQTSRSGGKGGQNVNKVETKVELSFDVEASYVLKDRQKQTILKKHPSLIDGRYIRITASTSRSQLENKEEAQKKLISLIDRLLKPEKKRIATKPGKAAKLKKLEDKKKRSEKKSNRQKPPLFH